MERRQHLPGDLAGADQVVDQRPRDPQAGRAAAVRVERRGRRRGRRRSDPQHDRRGCRAGRGARCAPAARSRRGRRRSGRAWRMSSGVPTPIRYRGLSSGSAAAKRSTTSRLAAGSLADGDAADGVAVEVERHQLLDRALAQVADRCCPGRCRTARSASAAVALARPARPGQRCGRARRRRPLRSTGQGGHSSSTMARSTPIRCCISTTDSGVKRTALPSRWLLKSTPSSSTERQVGRARTPGSRRCRSRASATSRRSGAARRRARWSRCRAAAPGGRGWRASPRRRPLRAAAGPSPLTAPSVPTGMKHGVSTTPCAVVSRPRRAEPSRARSSKVPRPTGDGPAVLTVPGSRSPGRRRRKADRAGSGSPGSAGSP